MDKARSVPKLHPGTLEAFSCTLLAGTDGAHQGVSVLHHISKIPQHWDKVRREKQTPAGLPLDRLENAVWDMCWGANPALRSHLGGGNGSKTPPPHPSHKDIASVPRESQLPELWAAFCFTFFGKPVPAFPCLLLYSCSSTLHTQI